MPGVAHEDCWYDCPLPAGAYVSGFRFKYVPAFHSHGGDASRAGRTIYGGPVCRALLLRGGRDHGYLRDSAAGEPVCGSGANAPGSRAVQHSYVSPSDEPEWYWDGC